MNNSKIFFDSTGRRWRIIVGGILTSILLLMVFIYIFLPKALSNPAPVPYEESQAFPEVVLRASTLATSEKEKFIDMLRSSNTPIIGNGPLIRVVELRDRNGGTNAVDFHTGKTTKELSTDEKTVAENSNFAIERYGASNGKRLSLTFDDGPDPVYSPQILDTLAKYDIPSTFFVLGENVIKEEAITNRMVREGHVLANHTFRHINFDLVEPEVGKQEIIQTQRAIRAVTGYETSFFRIPYGGNNDQAMRDNLRAILEAQTQGYIVTSYDFDTNDWDPKQNKDIKLPDMTGTSDIVMLLHDAGGDRKLTVEYIEQLASEAKKHGYTFANLNQLYTQDRPLFRPIVPTVEDEIVATTAQAVYVWPHVLLNYLFFLTVFSVIFGLLINTTLALLQNRKATYKRRANKFNPLVTVLVPAYNEASVIAKTVKSLLRSSYRNLEIIIINDGSTDDTKSVGQKLAMKSKKVRFLSQKNGGKAAALNHGIAKAKGEIVICVDADTLFPSYTVTRLIKHFIDPVVGAVAGSVKVGNISNLITRWQALEYTISIYLERNAQAYLDAVMIVPGACGAWRKEAIQKVGGYSSNTLAEDCDLTLSLQHAGYKVIQDNRAVAYTEAPDELQILAKQRFRWIFGNMQSFWKHKRIVFRTSHGWLGIFVMPYAVFNIVTPILFIPMLTMLALVNLANGRYETLLVYAGITLLIQFLAATISVLLAKERLSLLLAVPYTRLVYTPLKTYLLYKSVVTIISGSNVSWNKFKRTGTVASLVYLRQGLKKPQPSH